MVIDLVMAGLVPAISLRDALCLPKRDHRDKPGDDKRSFLRVNSRHASSPVFFTGAGYAVVQPPLSKEPRARGTPRVLTDPRASTPRDIEACRSPFCPPSLLTSFGAASRKSAKSDGVPRAVFEGLLREVPGSRAFTLDSRE